MRSFKTRYIQLALIPLIAVMSSGCKKEIDPTFEVNDQTVYDVRITKGKLKNEAQYISILTTNLFQQPLSVTDLIKTQNVIASIGDKALVNEIIISNYMNESNVILPSDSLMRADLDQFIIETYKRFYIREPSQLELSFFKNYIGSSPNVTVELVYTSFAASDEYLFY